MHAIRSYGSYSDVSRCQLPSTALRTLLEQNVEEGRVRLRKARDELVEHRGSEICVGILIAQEVKDKRACLSKHLQGVIFDVHLRHRIAKGWRVL